MWLTLWVVLAAGPAPELGKVTWERDFDVAVARARAQGKPLLVLFDEVPGCSTVLGFGEGALSDPEVVAAVQRDFVPVAVFNNVPGADAKVLASFGEPAWNNPVVRIIDADRRALAPRFAGPYSVEAFRAWLQPFAAKPVETVTVAAACFWECEARLGKLEAVRSSRVGYLAGEEVVEVQFDPRVTSRRDFLQAARQLDCAPRVFTRSDDEQQLTKALLGGRAVRTDEPLRYSEKDTKYFLRSSGRSLSGLSAQQQVRENAKLR